MLGQTVRQTTEEEQEAENSQEIQLSSTDAILTKKKERSKLSKSIKICILGNQRAEKLVQ